jgi:CopG family nickel-responsive transcriptional regulator
MSGLTRLSLSLDRNLLRRLAVRQRAAGYRNRSEFIRDLIRDHLVKAQWTADAEVVGAITMVYNHEARQLQERLTKTQHHHHGLVLATTHLHLDEAHCLEVIMVRGRAHEVRHLCDHLRRQKGVLHAALTMSAAGTELE